MRAIKHTDPPVSLRRTFSNCHVLFGYLRSFVQHRCSRLNCRTTSMRRRARINRFLYNQPCWCQLDRNCVRQTSSTTKVVDDTAYSSASAPSWTRTQRGGWIQIFGGKASEPETSRPVDKRIFAYHIYIWRRQLEVVPSEFRRYLLHHKTRIHGRCCWDLTFSRFDTIPACDGRTHDESKYRASIASRG